MHKHFWGCWALSSMFALTAIWLYSWLMEIWLRLLVMHSRTVEKLMQIKPLFAWPCGKPRLLQKVLQKRLYANGSVILMLYSLPSVKLPFLRASWNDPTKYDELVFNWNWTTKELLYVNVHTQCFCMAVVFNFHSSIQIQVIQFKPVSLPLSLFSFYSSHVPFPCAHCSASLKNAP